MPTMSPSRSPPSSGRWRADVGADLGDVGARVYGVGMIGTLESFILDCPDPQALARFYSELIGAEIVGYDPDWAEIVPPGALRPLIAFQRVDEYNPPQWPSQSVPQQMHIDVKVEDFDVSEPEVLALGATKAGSDHATFRVYLDPAGHPFCLVTPQD
jgi:hypothetical protein